MGFSSITHWLVLLVIILLVFGTKRLRNLGSDLGSAIKGFRSAMSEGEQAQQDAPTKQVTATPTETQPTTAPPPASKVNTPEQTRDS